MQRRDSLHKDETGIRGSLSAPAKLLRLHNLSSRIGSGEAMVANALPWHRAHPLRKNGQVTINQALRATLASWRAHDY